MPIDPIAVGPQKPAKSRLQPILGVRLNGSYIGVYRWQDGYVVCAVSANEYVCGWYQSLNDALSDYREAVRQWLTWAKQNGLLDVAEKLEKHLALLEKEKQKLAAIA